MRYRSVKNWSKVDELRGLLFFAQRLDELTFSYSLDSHKSSTISIQGLVLEALELIERSESQSNDNARKTLNSLAHVLDELKYRLSGNWIAKAICSVNVDDILSIDVNKNTADFIKRRLSLIKGELSSEVYISEIVQRVISLSADGKQKEKLELLAKELVSTIQFLGVSREHINDKVSETFWGRAVVSSPEVVRKFCQDIYPHQHNYLVFMGVTNDLLEISESVLRPYNVMVIGADLDNHLNGYSSDPEKVSALLTDVKRFKEKQEIECLLLAQINASDYRSAFSVAIKRVEEILNLYCVFHHKSKILLGEVALIEQVCCEGIRRELDAPENNMFFARNMRSVKASSALRKYSERMRIDVGPDAIRFENVVNIHGMSLRSSSPDIQLVNLWTCLETITPWSDGASNIGNVVNKITPILMLNYINRLVVNLLFDVLRWDRRVLTGVLKSAQFKGELDFREKFVTLLASGEHEIALSSLLEKCKDFELLRNRLYSMSQLLSSPTAIRERLKQHETVVRWQLHRIYRTRNSIVHSGSSPSHTRYLVENSHDYFDQVLMYCIEISSWKTGYDSFLACFDYAERKYLEYSQRISSGDATVAAWVLPKYRGHSYIFPDA